MQTKSQAKQTAIQNNIALQALEGVDMFGVGRPALMLVCGQWVLDVDSRHDNLDFERHQLGDNLDDICNVAPQAANIVLGSAGEREQFCECVNHTTALKIKALLSN